MAISKETSFTFSEIEIPFDGVEAYNVFFESTVIPVRDKSPDEWTSKGAPRRAFGRAILLNPQKVALRIYPFYELIHRSWMPGTHNFVRLGPNLGTSLSEFIYDGGGPELKDLTKFDKERGGRVVDELGRCVFACNTLQTGFVRGNGFVVAPQPGEQPPHSILIRKPDGALGPYDREYVPLGPTERKRKGTIHFNGRYDVIVLAPEPRVCQLPLEQNQCQEPLPELAFSSPIILEGGNPKVPQEVDYCPNDIDQTVGNEVNWHPATTCTSFTAFGINRQKWLVVVSMIEGLRMGNPPRNRGITASEMGWLMSQPELGATDGVIGGGAADTQQFLDVDCDDMPMLLEAPPRFKRPEEGGVAEVLGARGLGAIFAVLQK